MAHPTHTPRSIVALFPSVRWLADKLGIEQAAVRHWYNREPHGVPAKYWPDLVRLSEGEGVSLTYADLVAANTSAAASAA